MDSGVWLTAVTHYPETINNYYRVAPTRDTTLTIAGVVRRSAPRISTIRLRS